MKNLYVLFALFFCLMACAGNDGTELTIKIEADTPQEEFFANLLEILKQMTKWSK